MNGVDGIPPSKEECGFVYDIGQAKNRHEAALVYEAAMRHFGQGEMSPRSPWPGINKAILTRWKKSGLMFIKAEAWKRIAQ